jgi:prepilin peptidase CpaA
MDLIKAAACTVLAMLAFSDLRSRRLPNVGVAGFAALYLVDAALTGSSRATLEAHAAAGLFSLVLAAVFFRFGWLAGGDAKLAAAVFLWSGPTYAIGVLLIVSVCGSFLGLAMLALGLVARSTALRAMTQRLTWVEPKRGVPYGVALVVGGTVAVLLQPVYIAGRLRLAFDGPSSLHQIGFALFHHARLA